MKRYAGTPEQKKALLGDASSTQNALYTDEAPEDLENLQ
jgi:hypothetical protein